MINCFYFALATQLVAKCGHKWSVIAAKLKDETGKQSRVGKQIRERFLHHLDPTLKKGPWTPEEVRVFFCIFYIL